MLIANQNFNKYVGVLKKIIILNKETILRRYKTILIHIFFHMNIHN